MRKEKLIDRYCKTNNPYEKKKIEAIYKKETGKTLTPEVCKINKPLTPKLPIPKKFTKYRPKTNIDSKFQTGKVISRPRYPPSSPSTESISPSLSEALDSTLGLKTPSQPTTPQTSFLKRKRQSQVFLSYGKPNLQDAFKLYCDLKEMYELWFDKVSLKVGQNWKSVIRRAIQKSDFFIALLSSRTVNRRGFYYVELRYAYEVYQEFPPEKIFLLPVRLDNCEIPDFLKEIHYVDLFPNWEEGVQHLIEAIRYQESRHQ